MAPTRRAAEAIDAASGTALCESAAGMTRQLLAATGLVLAAGYSRRMGRPKALLPCTPTGETFVARAVRVLLEGGIADVAVVHREDDVALRVALEQARPRPRLVVNPTPELGQISSLLAGIDDAEARGAQAVVVLPVDMPQVQAGSVAALLEAARSASAPILRVVHAGRHGHPVMFRRAVFPDLRAADPTVGARAIFHGDAYLIRDVPVDDPGVLRDVDVPADYEEIWRDGR